MSCLRFFLPETEQSFVLTLANLQVELLGPAIDHLFSMCCMQYRYVLQTMMKVDNANGKEVGSTTIPIKYTFSEQSMQEIFQVCRLLQYLTMKLMFLYDHSELVKRASSAVTSEYLCKIRT